jgi:hypothetical protein
MKYGFIKTDFERFEGVAVRKRDIQAEDAFGPDLVRREFCLFGPDLGRESFVSICLGQGEYCLFVCLGQGEYFNFEITF